MIIGNGMIARRFFGSVYQTLADTIIFASGVSNSKTTDKYEFEREQELMYETIEKYPGAKVVYFGTCSIYDPSVNQSLYIRHKLFMEALIQRIADSYLIIRATNLVGHSTNPHLIMNFLTSKIRNHEPFDYWVNSVRNILDIDNFYEAVVQRMDKNNETINICNSQSYPILGIIQAIERHYKKRAITIEKDKGSDFQIKGIGLKIQSDDYLGFLLNKYYPIKIPAL